MPKQLLIDGHSLLFRAYHALPPLTRTDGTPTGALHGFANMLLKVVKTQQPDRVVVAFDAPQKTFRHDLDADYKGTRTEAPDDFKIQVPLVQELLQHLGIAELWLGGYEADDLIGTLARMGEDRGYQSEIITGDRDLLQIISEDVTVYLTQRLGISVLERIDREGCVLKLGVTPEQVPDFKGLMGDPSDNIRGVAGIGEKSARQLLAQFGSIEGIYQNLGSIDNRRWLKALTEQQAQALSSRHLATIDCTVPIDWPEVAEPFEWRITPRLEQFLAAMELDSLRRRLTDTSTRRGVKLEQASEPPSIPEFPKLAVDSAEMVDEDSFTLDASTEVLLLSPHAPYLLLRGDRMMTRWSKSLPAARYLGWGTKALLRELKRQGESIDIIEDGKLQAYLLNSEARAYHLKDVALRSGAVWQDDEEYQIRLALTLIQKQAEAIAANGLEAVYRDLEIPLIPVLADMEYRGIAVDADKLQALGNECERLLSELQDQIYTLAGSEFNIHSTQQLAQVLFDTLQLPVGKKTKTGYSTDQDTLERLRPLHPIVDKILSFRQLSKIKGTYVEGMVGLIDASGRLHTTFHQTVAATGRLSSSDPNLQNIPVRDAMGRRVRSVFVPSPGQVLSAADYSQIELRMLAHLSGDQHLIQAFEDGEDIHRRTAAEMFNLKLDEVNQTWRNRAKAINFGIIYGISGFGLARDTGVSAKEASDYIQRYYARYPRLKQYFDEILEGAREQGAVTTILGRVRPLPEIHQKDRTRRQYAERMAINTVIQGSAADLIKRAMVEFARHSRSQSWRSKLTLQVHDELIWDMDPTEEDQVMSLAIHLMTTVMPLRVPLLVELKHGPDWEHMIPFVVGGG